MLTIENDRLRISVKPMGAELASIYDKQKNIELLWQAGPEWPKHAPLLFPIVGQLFDNMYYYNGEAYTLPRHGFAREKNFALEEKGMHRLLFRLCDDEQTRAVYPFRFILEASFLLEDNELRVKMTVVNPDTKPLYFSIGGHPAFRVPLRDGENYNDYALQFDKNITAQSWSLQKGLIAGEVKDCIVDAATIQLEKSLFENDALVFKSFPAKDITLKNKSGESFFKFHLNDCPYFGLWAAKNADFVCIEPWQGIADSIHSDQDISDKEGIQCLAAGEVFNFEYRIELL